MTRLLVLFGCAALLAAPPARAAETAPATSKAPAAKGTAAKPAGKGSASKAAGAEAPPKLSAEQVAERNVKARGGLEAWRAVTTLKMAGDMDAGGKGETKLPFVLALKRPHKSRLELTVAGKSAVQTYDGTQGWKYRPYLNREDIVPFTPEEAKAAAATAELDGPLIDYAAKGTAIALVGTEKVEGRQTYKLRLTPRGGDSRLLWVDASTFLETKITGQPRKLDGRPHDVEVFYRDFRAVNGLKIPHVLETVVTGVKGSHKIAVRSVAVNPPLEDALFAKPLTPAAKAVGG